MIDYVADDNWASINPSDIPAGGYTSLARLAWGGFVIVEGRQGGISAEIFDDAGKPAGTVQKIPGAANGFAAGLSDGGFVITWDASDDSLNGVFVQRFTAQGQPIGGAIAVNQVTSGSQQPYSAIGFADGGFAVSWTSSNTNTVAVRLFSANATAQGDEIVLATSPTFGKYSPRLAAWDDGRFVATWAGSFDSQGGDTVYAQVLNRDGTRVGPEIRIANFPHDGHGNSYNAVAALDNGNFVMTWTRRDYAPNGGALDQVWAQVFNHSGQSIGSAFQVNAPSIYRSYLGQVSALGDGFIVVWQDDNPAFGPNFSDRGDVHARIYDASGNAIGAEFIVNETLERGQSQPLVTQFGTDDFAIAWSQTIATGDSVRLFYSVTKGTPDAETITGTADIDVLKAGEGNDTLVGLGGDDALEGGAGNDVIDGGPGIDQLQIHGNRADFKVTREAGGLRLTDMRGGSANQGSDLIKNVEKFNFLDGALSTAQLLTYPATSFGLYLQNGAKVAVVGDGRVFGSNAAEELTIVDDTGVVALDGSFARGNDLVRLPGYAREYTLALAGSSATFSRGDLTVVIPIGTAGLTVAFTDGARELIFDQGAALFGNWPIPTQPAEIAAPADGTTVPPLSPDSAPPSMLVLSPANPTSYYGNAQVFGTNGVEKLEALGGEIVLDASFARGGDTVRFLRPASWFDAKLMGSAVKLTWSAGEVTIPIGTAGTTIDFAGDARILRYDQAANKVLLGTQELSQSDIVVDIAPLSLTTDIGILA